MSEFSISNRWSASISLFSTLSSITKNSSFWAAAMATRPTNASCGRKKKKKRKKSGRKCTEMYELLHFKPVIAANMYTRYFDYDRYRYRHKNNRHTGRLTDTAHAHTKTNRYTYARARTHTHKIQREQKNLSEKGSKCKSKERRNRDLQKERRNIIEVI